jgi:GntR family transcriptional regulator, transcriptional repressor for pyruvate dehydrogenase complex
MSLQRPKNVGERVRAPKLSHLVAERLRTQIAEGELSAGDSLPSEAQLLEQFGVSRPTLREALRVLEAETLIQLGRGARSGAIVLGPSIEAVARYSGTFLASRGTTLGEIHQVRMLLEPQLAALLAQRSRKDDVKALRACVKAQQDGLARGDYLAVISDVIEFHDVMVRSSENSALGLLSGMLHDISLKVYPQMLVAGSTSERQAVRRRTEQSAAAHSRLLELITDGKVRESEEFWRNYMQDTAGFLARTGLGKLRVQLSTDYSGAKAAKR